MQVYPICEDIRRCTFSIRCFPKYLVYHSSRTKALHALRKRLDDCADGVENNGHQYKLDSAENIGNLGCSWLREVKKSAGKSREKSWKQYLGSSGDDSAKNIDRWE